MKKSAVSKRLLKSLRVVSCDDEVSLVRFRCGVVGRWLSDSGVAFAVVGLCFAFGLFGLLAVSLIVSGFDLITAAASVLWVFPLSLLMVPAAVGVVKWCSGFSVVFSSVPHGLYDMQQVMDRECFLVLLRKLLNVKNCFGDDAGRRFAHWLVRGFAVLGEGFDVDAVPESVDDLELMVRGWEEEYGGFGTVLFPAAMLRREVDVVI